MEDAITAAAIKTLFWIWPFAAVAMLGVASRMLDKIFNGSYASPSPSTQAARRERAQRQAQRAAYLEHLSQRQIEPVGYIADQAAPSEPDWVTPVYTTGDTYEQPPASWANTNAATYHQRRRRVHDRQFWIDRIGNGHG
jgi:hypothetical protein